MSESGEKAVVRWAYPSDSTSDFEEPTLASSFEDTTSSTFVGSSDTPVPRDVSFDVSAIPIGSYLDTGNVDRTKLPSQNENLENQWSADVDVDQESPEPYSEAPAREESTNTEMVKRLVDVEYAGERPTILDGKKIRRSFRIRKSAGHDESVIENVQDLSDEARGRVLGRTAATVIVSYARSWHKAAMNFAHARDFAVPAPYYEEDNMPGALRKGFDSTKYNTKRGALELLPIIRLGGSTAIVGTGLAIAASENWEINGTIQPVDTFAVMLLAMLTYSINEFRKSKVVTVTETPRRIPKDKHAVATHVKQLGLDVVDTIDNYARAKDKVIIPPMRNEKGKVPARERLRYFNASMAQEARRASRAALVGTLATTQLYAWFIESRNAGNTQPFDNVVTFISTFKAIDVMQYRPVHPAQSKEAPMLEGPKSFVQIEKQKISDYATNDTDPISDANEEAEASRDGAEPARSTY